MGCMDRIFSGIAERESSICAGRSKPLRTSQRWARGSPLNKAETLEEIKRAEAEIPEMKEAAARERDRIGRDARRESIEVRERLRREADERAAAVVRAAEAEIARDRESVLAKGRREADALRSAGMATVERGVEDRGGH